MLHASTASMLQESLPEYLCAARWCVQFRKDDSWPAPGRLGYPAALMLFCIADSIGSYHRRGHGGILATVDGKPAKIGLSGPSRLYVLNTEYYGQTLSHAEIAQLYSRFRGVLVHNAALAPDWHLISKPALPDAFPQFGGQLSVNIDGFLRVSERAVAAFLERAPVVVPGSEQEADIARKR